MAQNKKPEYLILFVALLGLFILFIFPEPETNFLAYVATAGVFILIIVLLINRWNERAKKQSKPDPSKIHNEHTQRNKGKGRQTIILKEKQQI